MYFRAAQKLALVFMGTVVPLLCPVVSSALEVPENAPLYTLVVVKHEADCYLEISNRDVLDFAPETTPGTTVFTGPPGKYDILEVYKNAEGKYVANRASVVIGTTPTPDPLPVPDPVDPVNPDPPTPTASLRVMLLHETEDRGKSSYPLEALSSVTVRKYLNSHCPLDSKGVPGWRLWDDDYTDEQLSHENAEAVTLYRKAKSDSKGTLPWMVITAPNGSRSQKVPATELELLAVLKEFGGP